MRRDRFAEETYRAGLMLGCYSLALSGFVKAFAALVGETPGRYRSH